MQITERLAQLKQANGKLPVAIDDIISSIIIQAVKNDRFMGEILMQLPRQFDEQFNGAVGLGWTNQQITLLINPQQFKTADFTVDDLYAILKQVALHLTFAHPLMYPRANSLNQLACDIVVDQYLDQQSQHTLDQVNFQFGTDLMAQMGSHYYLDQLSQIDTSGKHSIAKQAADLINGQSEQHDAHSAWHQFGDHDRDLQQGLLKRIVSQAWQRTPDKQRGTVPGNVVSAIDHRNQSPRVKNWQALLSIGLGTTPFAHRDSRARFNRRQAYRMELPGRISNTIRQINVFVDNSGSMGDSEISAVLNEIHHFMNQTPVTVVIYSFDSVVHFAARYRANSGAKIRYQRIGGGGTSFQAIFNFLSAHRKSLNDTLTIILTDGKGEQQLNARGFNHIIWLLTTPVSEFSLVNHGYPGRAISLNESQ